VTGYCLATSALKMAMTISLKHQQSWPWYHVWRRVNCLESTLKLMQ